jgi:Tol biopolymer transport system component
MFGQPPEFWVEHGASRHLYLYDLRTDKTSEISGSAGLFSPRWSPDGRYVVAMSVDLQGMSLLDKATGKWRPLVRHPVDSPFWSLDSAWVYFNNVEDTGVWRVRVTNGVLEAVGPTPVPPGYSEGSCRARAFAPDGAVLLDCRDSRTDIFALDYKD